MTPGRTNGKTGDIDPCYHQYRVSRNRQFVLKVNEREKNNNSRDREVQLVVSHLMFHSEPEQTKAEYGGENERAKNDLMKDNYAGDHNDDGGVTATVKSQRQS